MSWPVQRPPEPNSARWSVPISSLLLIPKAWRRRRRSQDFGPPALSPLPFPAVLIAARNDPHCARRARPRFRRGLGARNSSMPANPEHSMSGRVRSLARGADAVCRFSQEHSDRAMTTIGCPEGRAEDTTDPAGRLPANRCAHSRTITLARGRAAPKLQACLQGS